MESRLLWSQIVRVCFKIVVGTVWFHTNQLPSSDTPDSVSGVEGIGVVCFVFS